MLLEPGQIYSAALTCWQWYYICCAQTMHLPRLLDAQVLNAFAVIVPHVLCTHYAPASLA